MERGGRRAGEVTAFLDTSIVVRYLTGDPPQMAERAARILDGEEELILTDVVLAETAYVLTSFYRVPRRTAVDTLIDLILKRNVSLHGREKTTAIEAMLLCRPSKRVSFVDALVWSLARASGLGRIYTFDDRFPADGLHLLSEPPQ